MFALLLLTAGADPQPYTVRVHTPIVYTVVNHCPLVVPTPPTYPGGPVNYGTPPVYYRTYYPSYVVPYGGNVPTVFRSSCPGGVCPIR